MFSAGKVFLAVLLFAPGVALANLTPLNLVDRMPAQQVVGREPIASGPTLPGKGFCHGSTCIYTWTQSVDKGGDTYYIRTTSTGVPTDIYGQVLGSGDGGYVHLQSEVFWLGDAFGIVWRSAKGKLRFRRVGTRPDDPPSPPVDLADGVPGGSGNEQSFAVAVTDSGFVAVWLGANAFMPTWSIQAYDFNGTPQTKAAQISDKHLAGFRAARWRNGLLIVVRTGSRYSGPAVVAVSLDGQIVRTTSYSQGPINNFERAAALFENGDGFTLIQAIHANSVFSLRRFAVDANGVVDASAVEERITGEDRNSEGRERIELQDGVGIFMWGRGGSSQDPIAMLARRFNLNGGWIDDAPFAISNVVPSALEGSSLFATSAGFVAVWNDPYHAPTRTGCSRFVPTRGDPGLPMCRILSIGTGYPIEPVVRASKRGYWVEWKPLENSGWNIGPRQVRYAPDGTRLDASPFVLPQRTFFLSSGGPEPLIGYRASPSPIALPVGDVQQWQFPFPGGVNVGDAYPETPTVSWNGQRHLGIWIDNGNIADLGNAFAGRFVRLNGELDPLIAGFGTYRVRGNNPTLGPSHAVGSNATHHLVVWVHELPESTLEDTYNELALLDHNGHVVENFGFGEREKQDQPDTSSCMGPAAIAGDADGFLIACGLTSVARRGIKILGYRAGAPPWSMGVFSPTGMTNPSVSTSGDGIHLVWAREQEIVQSLIRRSGDGVIIENDQHTFPFRVADPRVASADPGRVALVYRKLQADNTATLMFHLLDPDAPIVSPDIATLPTDAGVLPMDAIPTMDGEVAATPTAAGCTCTTGKRNTNRAPPLWLFALLWIGYRRRRRKLDGAMAGIVLLALLAIAGCNDRPQLLPTESSSEDAATTDDAAVPESTVDAAAVISLPEAGPLPVFTPAYRVDAAIPVPVIPIDTNIDCDTGVAAQIANGKRYRSVQDALTSAKHGDTVQICPGQHQGGLLLTAAITLTSFSGNAGDTVLDGQSTTRILRIVVEGASNPIRLQHLTLRNGRAVTMGSVGPSGAAMHVSSSAPVEILDCVVEQNAGDYGGAIMVSATVGLTVARSFFRNNKAGYGEAVLSIGYRRHPATVVIEDSRFEKNTANSEAGVLGVGHSDMPTGTAHLAIRRSVFLDNSAGYRAGAIDVWSGFSPSHLTLSIESCRFENNSAGHTAGVVNLSGSGQSTVSILDSVFEGNISGNEGSVFAFGESFRDEGDTPAIVIAGGTIRRNGANGKIAAIQFSQPMVMILQNVDLGVGENDNTGGDIKGCPKNYGANTTITVRGSQGGATCE
jgi:hypothetical protein